MQRYDRTNGEVFAEVEQRRAERAITKAIIAQYKLASRFKDFYAECESRREDVDITLKVFNEVVYDFPYLIERIKFPFKLHTHKSALLPNIMCHFDKTPFYLEYVKRSKELQQRDVDRTLALIFPRKGIIGGLVLYAGTATDNGSHFSYRDNKTATTYTLCRYRDWLLTINR